jgi:Skp family chaperone for outer membrane proteins
VVILEQTSSGILYYADGVDLTDEVIELLNKK